jgi:hypothetical protein
MYYPYLKQETFLSPAELEFLKKLKVVQMNKALLSYGTFSALNV